MRGYGIVGDYGRWEIGGWIGVWRNGDGGGFGGFGGGLFIDYLERNISEWSLKVW